VDEEMVLVVETDDGLFIRNVPPAAPIPESDDPGAATEDVIRWTTMHWGLPDFVFAPKSVRTGRAVREIGDAVLYAGDIAASCR
jgi:hypothetical protein